MTTQPLTPTAELADLSRRYAALKARLLDVALTREAMGMTPLAAMGITISSRFMLRMVLFDVTTGAPAAALAFGPGEPQITEEWNVDGEIVSF